MAAAAAGAGAGKGDDKDALGFRGYLEKPPWDQTTTHVKPGLHPAWTRAAGRSGWLYGLPGYIAVVHWKNTYGPAVVTARGWRDTPLLSRTWTIAVLSGVFDEKSTWTHIATLTKTHEKREERADYVDNKAETTWLCTNGRSFIDASCKDNPMAPMWMVFEPCDFYGECARGARYDMVHEKDFGCDWFLNAKRPMFADVIEIRPTETEHDDFELSQSLFDRLSRGDKRADQNLAATALEAAVKTTATPPPVWKPMAPPKDFKGHVRVWTISLERQLGDHYEDGDLVSFAGSGHVVGVRDDAVKKAMSMIPAGGKYQKHRVDIDSVTVLFSGGAERTRPAAAAAAHVMVAEYAQSPRPVATAATVATTALSLT